MSERLDWDAYRYVLDDPTLDRAAFEARMLGDVDLALSVAQAVLHVDSIRAASFVAVPANGQVVSDGSAGAANSGWRLSSLFALAVGLLLAIGLLNYRVMNSRSYDNSSALTSHSGVIEQNLAESWLAIRQTELVDGSSNLVDVSTNLDSLRDEDESPDAIESLDEDWLMDAAREFYAQGEAG